MEKAMGIGAMPLYNGACALRCRFSLIICVLEDPYGNLEGKLTARVSFTAATKKP
jgi:hypothetical protein